MILYLQLFGVFLAVTAEVVKTCVHAELLYLQLFGVFFVSTAEVVKTHVHAEFILLFREAELPCCGSIDVKIRANRLLECLISILTGMEMALLSPASIVKI